MDRLSSPVLTIWRTIVLASFLAWLPEASPLVQAQELDLAWATSAGSFRGDAGSSITVDKMGNSYVTGFIHNNALFGQGEAHHITLTDPERSLFLAKYDARGRVVWAQKLGNRSTPFKPKVAVDGAGHVYVINGDFRGQTTQDNRRVHGTWTGSPVLVFAKYDPDGRQLWVTDVVGSLITPGRSHEDVLSSTGLAVDAAGNSYVTGNIRTQATFEAGEAQETTLVGPGVFVAKYDRNGRLLWAKSGESSTNSALSSSIVVDQAGDISVIGHFAGAATFGVEEVRETTLHADGTDIFVVIYAPNGTLRWARQAGGAGEKHVYSAAVHSAGHLYVTGDFTGPTATFGDANAYYRTLVSRDKPQLTQFQGDIFIAKFRGEPPFVLLANTFVTLDRPGVSAGAIWSNGTLQFRPDTENNPSVFRGELTAVKKIILHPGNTITGTATAGSFVNVLRGATVTGEVLAHAPVTARPLPQPTFTAGGSNQTVPPRDTLPLAPGTYGQVTVGEGGTVQLRSGAYFLRTLALGNAAQLVVDVTDGPVQLNVVYRLTVGEEAQVTLTPEEADSDQLTITTLQTSRLTIGVGASVVGTLLAPQAAVTLASQSQLTGALWADEITVQPEVVLQPHDAAHRLQ
jgi:hypothetical protein